MAKALDLKILDLSLVNYIPVSLSSDNCATSTWRTSTHDL